VDLAATLTTDVARSDARRDPRPAGRATTHVGTPVALDLLGGFELCVRGESVACALSAQRVVAFLALHDRPVHRGFVAGTLWPDKSDERAGANLRSALWRLRQPGLRVIETRGANLRLSPEVDVDVTRQVNAGKRVVADPTTATDADLDLDGTGGDLLPDWYEDWVLLERERLRQLRLHALEVACVELTRRGEIARAIEAGLAAVAAEPLRESSTRALMGAHLAEGNRVEALRQFERYRRLLWEELSVPPTRRLNDILTELTGEAPAAQGGGSREQHEEDDTWAPRTTRR
jgi:DNA-binding SARP family transcriptional activator